MLEFWRITCTNRNNTSVTMEVTLRATHSNSIHRKQKLKIDWSTFQRVNFTTPITPFFTFSEWPGMTRKSVRVENWFLRPQESSMIAGRKSSAPHVPQFVTGVSTKLQQTTSVDNAGKNDHRLGGGQSKSLEKGGIGACPSRTRVSKTNSSDSSLQSPPFSVLTSTTQATMDTTNKQQKQ